MGHGHSDKAAGHVGGRYRSRLAIAFVLTATFFLVELVAGLLSGSLALIADAGHMATDVVALGGECGRHPNRGTQGHLGSAQLRVVQGLKCSPQVLPSS